MKKYSRIMVFCTRLLGMLSCSYYVTGCLCVNDMDQGVISEELPVVVYAINEAVDVLKGKLASASNVLSESIVGACRSYIVADNETVLPGINSFDWRRVLDLLESLPENMRANVRDRVGAIIQDLCIYIRLNYYGANNCLFEKGAIRALTHHRDQSIDCLFGHSSKEARIFFAKFLGGVGYFLWFHQLRGCSKCSDGDDQYVKLHQESMSLEKYFENLGVVLGLFLDILVFSTNSWKDDCKITKEFCINNITKGLDKAEIMEKEVCNTDASGDVSDLDGAFFYVGEKMPPHVRKHKIERSKTQNLEAWSNLLKKAKFGLDGNCSYYDTQWKNVINLLHVDEFIKLLEDKSFEYEGAPLESANIKESLKVIKECKEIIEMPIDSKNSYDLKKLLVDFYGAVNKLWCPQGVTVDISDVEWRIPEIVRTFDELKKLLIYDFVVGLLKLDNDEIVSVLVTQFGCPMDMVLNKESFCKGFFGYYLSFAHAVQIEGLWSDAPTVVKGWLNDLRQVIQYLNKTMMVRLIPLTTNSKYITYAASQKCRDHIIDTLTLPSNSAVVNMLVNRESLFEMNFNIYSAMAGIVVRSIMYCFGINACDRTSLLKMANDQYAIKPNISAWVNRGSMNIAKMLCMAKMVGQMLLHVETVHGVNLLSVISPSIFIE